MPLRPPCRPPRTSTRFSPLSSPSWSGPVTFAAPALWSCPSSASPSTVSARWGCPYANRNAKRSGAWPRLHPMVAARTRSSMRRGAGVGRSQLRTFRWTILAGYGRWTGSSLTRRRRWEWTGTSGQTCTSCSSTSLETSSRSTGTRKRRRGCSPPSWWSSLRITLAASWSSATMAGRQRWIWQREIWGWHGGPPSTPIASTSCGLSVPATGSPLCTTSFVRRVGHCGCQTCGPTSRGWRRHSAPGAARQTLP